METGSENTFPSTFDSSSDKGKKQYILDFAKNIWKQAIDERGSYNFEGDFDRFKNNRRYSSGTQSVDKFKQRFSIDGDTTYLNMNWEVSTPLPKIIEVMRGQMINQPYKAQFKATDSLSVADVDKKRRSILAKMKTKEALGDLEKQGLVKISDTELPENEEALDVYMSTNFKLGQCMAMEALSRAILEDNDYEDIESKIAKDLIDLKIAGVRVGLDHQNNIYIRYIDPVNLITSYVRKDDFSDAKFIGEIRYITIDDLRVQATELSEEDLFNIAKSCAGQYQNSPFPYGDQYYNLNHIDPKRYGRFLVKVVDFEFFSTDNMVFEKQEARNGGYFFQQKPEGYESPKNPKRKREVSTPRVKNVYCGNWIVGTDHLYDYGKKRFMVRKRQNNKYSTNTKLGFIVFAPDMYDMQNKSKVEEAIPIAEELILNQLKIQQHIAKSKPSGYSINIDAVVGALKGMGMGGLTPLQARSITDQIGDVYYKAVDEMGRPLVANGDPIKPLPSGLDSSLGVLFMAYNNNLAKLKEVLGMNDAVDSSQPDERTAVGVQKLSLAAHKNALRTLYNSYLKITKEVVEYVSLLSQELIRKGINKEKYKNWIGEEAVRLIDMGKLPYYEYSITVEMLPDEEEKQRVEEMLALSVQSGKINLEDVFAVRRLLKEDVDKAEMLLAYREKKRAKEIQEQAMAQSQANAQSQAQASQAAEQAKQQTIMTEAEAKIRVIEKEYEFKIALERVKGEEDRKTEVVKGDTKEELIEKAAEVKVGQIETATSPKKPSGVGYDIQKDSIPNEAGKVEPSVMPDPTRNLTN